jgi:hypothetical protein
MGVEGAASRRSNKKGKATANTMLIRRDDGVDEAETMRREDEKNRTQVY